jgi:asparagine synthase (glutamine-hydrolysing)
MCGIAGVYEYGPRQPVSESVLVNMLHTLHHRGPDDEGIYLDHELALGMRRLSIIDPAGGRQPMCNEDRTIWCVCNGEIYNFEELRKELLAHGHQFASRSDTETLVHSYEEWGIACLEKLRGMFGFALWDCVKRTLFVVRDRLGIKPVYYADDANRLIFASEIKALLPHPEIDPALEPKALSHYLSFKYVPAPLTMFKGIRSLPPGHMLRCDYRGVTLSSYWDLPEETINGRRKAEGEYAEELEALLRESVKLHLVSDVPFGAFLSGGLDSSTIVALMTQFLDQPVKTFSVGFSGNEAEYSELPYARLVAQSCGTDHHELLIGARDFIDNAEKIVWHLDQPIADDACLANYMVAALASRDVKMVLTGEGGDELFAGYARYAGERFAPLFRLVPDKLKASALQWSEQIPGLRRPKLALKALCEPDEIARFVEWFPLFDHQTKQHLFSSEFAAALNGTSAREVFATQLSRTERRNGVSRMLYVDTKLWLPDDLLARGDKTSMAASIEARVPLLDHKLVEFAARLPLDLKLRGLQRKYLLRTVCRKWLPPEILHRKKKGFPIPISLWFRGEAREFVRDLLSPEAVRRRALFDSAQVARLISEHESGFADHGSRLSGLLGIELWYRTFIDRERRPAPEQPQRSTPPQEARCQ